MKGNQPEVNRLKSLQLEKKFLIDTYKLKAKKRLFIFSLSVVLITLFFLEESYKTFGSMEVFVLISLSFMLSVIIIYYAVIFILIRQRRKEIKRINGKIYNLMKLDENDQKN